ncbi:MAG: phosphatidate cytidylyltransferase [Simkaniaceae bacterium]
MTAIKDSELLKRIGISSVLILLLAAIIIFSQNIFFQFLIVGIILALSIIASYEFQYLMRMKEIKYPSLLLFIFTPLLVFSIFLTKWISQGVALPAFVLFFGLIFFSFYYYRRIENSLPSLAACFFSVCYIGIPLGLLLLILYPPLEIKSMGRLAIFYLLIVTKITDIGAYFIGKYLGRWKLAKTISPKKTFEGLLGGLIFAVLASLCFAKSAVFQFREFPIAQAIVLGLIIGIFGQLGDLVESLLKRDAKVKDSNRIPGLGGLLDMLDSLLFTAPLFFFYLNIISLGQKF